MRPIGHAAAPMQLPFPLDSARPTCDTCCCADAHNLPRPNRNLLLVTAVCARQARAALEIFSCHAGRFLLTGPPDGHTMRMVP